MIDITQTWFPDDLELRGYCADVECYEVFRPSHSDILDENGDPIPYEEFRVGFDLTAKKSGTGK